MTEQTTKALWSLQNKTALLLLEEKRQELTELAKESEWLAINWVEDKSGFQIVHAQEQKLIKARTYIEKTRKEYTAQFDIRKKEAIELEKELLAIIAPAEETLKAEKKRILDEQERLVIEAIRKEKERLNARIQAFAIYGKTIDLYTLEKMTEEEYTEDLKIAKEEWDKKQKELQAEKEAKEKYEKERAEFEAEKAKLEKEKKELEDQKRIENERQEKIAQEAKRKEEAEKLKKENEEAERIENEKQAEYIGWLKSNGVNEDNKKNYHIKHEAGVATLYIKISTYNL